MTTQAQILQVLDDLIEEQGEVDLEVQDWISRRLSRLKIATPWIREGPGGMNAWHRYHAIGERAIAMVEQRQGRWRWAILEHALGSVVWAHAAGGDVDDPDMGRRLADAWLLETGWSIAELEPEDPAQTLLPVREG